MKKALAFLSVIVIGAVVCAFFFNPFAHKNAYRYLDNEPIARADFFAVDGVRYDRVGTESDMYEELKSLCATPVKTVEVSGCTIVYAWSERVLAQPQTLADGRKYNVMAAYRDGAIAVGSPVLQGSY